MRYDEFLVPSVLDPFRFFPLIRCPSPKVEYSKRCMRPTYCANTYFTSYLDISRLPKVRMGAHGMSVQHTHHSFAGSG